MKGNIYIYILVMAVITYLVRMLPLAIIRKEIKNKYVKSFIFYVPYVTLSVMAFPGILYCIGDKFTVPALLGFAVTIVLAYMRKSLLTVSVAACITVLITQFIF